MSDRSTPARARRGWTRAILLTAVVALPLALPTSSAWAQGGQASAAAVANAIAFRESFGLRAGRSFVEGTMDDRSYSRVPCSIPL